MQFSERAIQWMTNNKGKVDASGLLLSGPDFF
jgi:hypothetical protein